MKAGPVAGAPPPPGYAYPPPGYAYPPPGYAYPPPGYAYPPPGYAYPPAGYYPPPPSRPGIGVFAILNLVANYGMACVMALVAVAAVVDGPDDATARWVTAAVSVVSTGLLVASSIGIHRARTWGAIMSLVLWAGFVILMVVIAIDTGGRGNDREAAAGLWMFAIGGLCAGAFAALSIPQLRKVRAWQPPGVGQP